MKLYPQARTIVFTLSMLSSTVVATVPAAIAQQPSTATSSTPKPIVVEWVYRTKYGYKDEWWRNLVRSIQFWEGLRWSCIGRAFWSVS